MTTQVERIIELEAEVERLGNELTALMPAGGPAAMKYRGERNAQLEEALQFYAAADVLYLGKGDHRTTLDELVQDNGATARAALAPEPTCPECGGKGEVQVVQRAIIGICPSCQKRDSVSESS